MVKIREKRHSQLFMCALLILAIFGAIFIGHTFSAVDGVKFTATNAITAFADGEDEDPDEEIDVSFGYITMRLTNYINRCSAGGSNVTSYLSNLTGNFENMGIAVGFSSGEPNGDKKGGIFGLVSILDTQSSSGYSRAHLANGLGTSLGSLEEYYNYGYKMQSIGYDEVGNTGLKIGRMLAGVFMLVAVVAAMAVGYVFKLLFIVLDFANPFRFFSQASAISGMIDADGYNLPGEFHEAEPASRLIQYFSSTYDSFADFAFNVVIPFTFTIFLVGFFISKAYRNSAMQHFKKFIIRAAFIVVGIPLLGSIYTTMLSSMATSFTVSGSYVTNVVASTFVDLRSVIETKGGVPILTSSGATAGSAGQLGRGTDSVSTNEWKSIRGTAFELNALGNFTSYNSTFSQNDGVFKPDSATSFDATDGGGGGMTDSSSDMTGTNAAYEAVLRYLVCDQYTPAQYESLAKSSSGLDSSTLGKRLAFMTYKYSFNAWKSSGGTKVKLPKTLSESEKTVIINGSAYLPPSGYSDASWSSTTFPLNGGTDVMSPLASYNYLNSEFVKGGISVYSPSAPTLFTRKQHYSTILVGGDLLMKGVLLINALVLLFAYVMIAVYYVFWTAVDAIFHGFDVMAEALFASLGMYKSIARCICAAMCILVEVFIALVFFSISTELMYSLSYLVDDATNTATSAYSGGSGGFSGRVMVTVSVLLATIIQFAFMRFCIRWRGRIIKSFEDTVREIIEQAMGVRMGAGMGAGDVASQMAKQDLATGAKAGVGAAMAAGAAIRAGSAAQKMDQADDQLAALDAEQAQKDAAEIGPDAGTGADGAAEGSSDGGSERDNSLENSGSEGDASDKELAESVGDSVAGDDGDDGDSTDGSGADGEGADGDSSSTSETSSETTEESSEDGGEGADGEGDGESSDGAVINGDAIVNGDAQLNGEGGEGSEGEEGDGTTDENLSNDLERAELEQQKAQAQMDLANEEARKQDAKDMMSGAFKDMMKGDMLAGTEGTRSGAIAEGAVGAAETVGDFAESEADRMLRNGKTKQQVTAGMLDAAQADLDEANANLANAEAKAREAHDNGVTEKHTYKDPETGRETTVETDPLTGRTTETTTDENGNTVTTDTSYQTDETGKMKRDENGKPIVAATSKTTKDPNSNEEHSEGVTYDDKGNAVATYTSDTAADGSRVSTTKDAKGNVVDSEKVDSAGNRTESYHQAADGTETRFQAEVDEHGNAKEVTTTNANGETVKTGAIAGVTSVTRDGQNSTTVTDAAGNSISVTGDADGKGNAALAYNADGSVKRNSDGQVLGADGKPITSAADLKGVTAAEIRNGDGTGSSVMRDSHGRDIETSKTELNSDGSTTTTSTMNSYANALSRKPETTTETQRSSNGENNIRMDGLGIRDINGDAVKSAAAVSTTKDAKGNVIGVAAVTKDGTSYETSTSGKDVHLADGGTGKGSSTRITSSDGRTVTDIESVSGTDKNGAGFSAERRVSTTSDKLGRTLSQTETQTRDVGGNVTSVTSTSDFQKGTTTSTTKAPNGDTQTVTTRADGSTRTETNRGGSMSIMETGIDKSGNAYREESSGGRVTRTTTMGDGSVRIDNHETGADGKRASSSSITTKPDGSVETIERRVGANGDIMSTTRTTTVSNGNGSTTQTVEALDANGKTTKSMTTTTDAHGNRNVTVSGGSGANRDVVSYTMSKDGNLTHMSSVGSAQNLGVDVSNGSEVIAGIGRRTATGSGSVRMKFESGSTMESDNHGGSAIRMGDLGSHVIDGTTGERRIKNAAGSRYTVSGDGMSMTTSSVDGSVSRVASTNGARVVSAAGVIAAGVAHTVNTTGGFNGASSHVDYKSNGHSTGSGVTAGGMAYESTGNKNQSGNVSYQTMTGGSMKSSYGSGGVMSSVSYENKASAVRDTSSFDGSGHMTSREIKGANGSTNYSASYDQSGKVTANRVATATAAGVNIVTGMNGNGTVTQTIKSPAQNMSQTMTRTTGGVETVRVQNTASGDIMQRTVNAQKGTSSVSYRSGGAETRYVVDGEGNRSVNEIRHSAAGANVQSTRIGASGDVQIMRENVGTGNFRQVSVGAAGGTTVMSGNARTGSAARVATNAAGEVVTKNVNAAGGFASSNGNVSAQQASAAGQRYVQSANNIVNGAMGSMPQGMMNNAARGAAAAAAATAGTVIINGMTVQMTGGAGVAGAAPAMMQQMRASQGMARPTTAGSAYTAQAFAAGNVNTQQASTGSRVAKGAMVGAAGVGGGVQLARGISAARAASQIGAGAIGSLGVSALGTMGAGAIAGYVINREIRTQARVSSLRDRAIKADSGSTGSAGAAYLQNRAARGTDNIMSGVAGRQSQPGSYSGGSNSGLTENDVMRMINDSAVQQRTELQRMMENDVYRRMPPPPPPRW